MTAAASGARRWARFRRRWKAVAVAVVAVTALVAVLLRWPSTGADDSVAVAVAAPISAVSPPLLAAIPLAVGCDVDELLPGPVGGVLATLTSAAISTSAYGDQQVCRVEGLIAPQIRFVVELPTRTYQQRYLQVGCGGLCGKTDSDVPQAAGCAPLTGGEFATATNDLGHVGPDGSFGANPQLRADFAYRADHVVAVVAKSLIANAYGRAPRWSYFTGCSQGGREGLTEAQRFPEDFDGIVAGAPAMIATELLGFYESWVSAVALSVTGEPLLDENDLVLVHQFVLARCDGDDGLADGLIGDPRTCDVDPGDLQCASSSAVGCLDPTQVVAVRALYSGPLDTTGRRLYPGGVQPGSELEWTGWILPEVPGATTGAQSLSVPWLAHLADVDLTDGRPLFDETPFRDAEQLAGLYDASDPDLSVFQDAGGRLVIYHGWADPAIPPTGTLAYYQAIQDEMGGLDATRQFARLFMVPGLAHCVDGGAPNSFDALTPVMRWVEDGVPPESIVTTNPDSGRTRPVYPYPQTTVHDGSGTIDDAASYSSAEPARAVDDTVAWAGSFPPGPPLWWDGSRLTTRRPPDQ